MRDYLAHRLNRHFGPEKVPRLSEQALKVWQDGGLSLDRIVYYCPPEIHPEQACPFVRQFSQFGTDQKMTRSAVHALIGHLWAMRLNKFKVVAEPISAEGFIEAWDGRISGDKSCYLPVSMNAGLSVAIEKDNSFPTSVGSNGRSLANWIEVARLEQIFRLFYKKDDNELFVLVRGDLEEPRKEFTSGKQRRKKDEMLEGLSKAFPNPYYSSGLMYPVSSMEELLLDTSADADFLERGGPNVPVNEAVVNYFKKNKSAFLLLHSTSTRELGRIAAEINRYYTQVVGGNMGPWGVRERIEKHTPWLPNPLKNKMLKLYGEFESQMAAYISAYFPDNIRDSSLRETYKEAMEKPANAFDNKMEWDQFAYETFYQPLCSILWRINTVVPEKSREGACGEIFKLPEKVPNDPSELVRADNFPWLFPHVWMPWLDAHVHRYRRELGSFQGHVQRFWEMTRRKPEDMDIFNRWWERQDGCYGHSDKKGFG